MSFRPAPRTSRRSFLKLGAAVAGALSLPLLRQPLANPSVPTLRLASALPHPGWPLLPDPEALLQSSVAARPLVDVALVPAYVAALLIQAGRLQPLRGPAGRPHDPEGRYTLPFAYRVAALRYEDADNFPLASSWADLWSAAGSDVASVFGRVITGAALLRRGYSPNDTHPGHLAQAAADLARLPRANPTVALVLADPAELGLANGPRLPAEGTLLIEYDWIITAGPVGQDAAAARQFIERLPLATDPPLMDSPTRLIPLMPLPPSAHAQHAAIWNQFTTRPTLNYP